MNTKDYILCGLFAAIMCVSAFITIPMFFAPIPLTLQVFAVCATAAILGGKRGATAVLIYILLGIFGLPVFSGMKGGLGVILGPTGGYIWGFIPAVFLSGLLVEKFGGKGKNEFAITCIALVLGLIVIYICGTIQLMLVANMGVVAALGVAVIPFVIFDIFKIILASSVAIAVRKHTAII